MLDYEVKGDLDAFFIRLAARLQESKRAALFKSGEVVRASLKEHILKRGKGSWSSSAKRLHPVSKYWRKSGDELKRRTTPAKSPYASFAEKLAFEVSGDNVTIGVGSNPVRREIFKDMQEGTDFNITTELQRKISATRTSPTQEPGEGYFYPIRKKLQTVKNDPRPVIKIVYNKQRDDFIKVIEETYKEDIEGLNDG